MENTMWNYERILWIGKYICNKILFNFWMKKGLRFWQVNLSWYLLRVESFLGQLCRLAILELKMLHNQFYDRTENCTSSKMGTKLKMLYLR
jgi:hypothetical protein